MACDVFDKGYYIQCISPGKVTQYYFQSKSSINKLTSSPPAEQLISSDNLFLIRIDDNTIDAIFSGDGADIFCEHFKDLDIDSIMEKCRERMQAISDTGIIVKSNASYAGICYVYNNEHILFNAPSSFMLTRLNSAKGDIFQITEDFDERNVHSCFITPDKQRFMERDMHLGDMTVPRMREWCADFYRASLENFLNENELIHMVSKDGRKFLFGLSTEGEDRYIGELPSFWASKRQSYVVTFLFENGGGMNVGRVNGNDVHGEIFTKEEGIKNNILFALVDTLSAAEKEHVDPTEKSWEAKEVERVLYFPDEKLLLGTDKKIEKELCICV